MSKSSQAFFDLQQKLLDTGEPEDAPDYEEWLDEIDQKSDEELLNQQSLPF